MNTIHKYPISTEDVQTIQLPEYAKILTVKTQHGKPVMWVLLDTEAPVSIHHFTLYTTGQAVPLKPGRYIDSFQMHDDNLVLHVFEDFG